MQPVALNQQGRGRQQTPGWRPRDIALLSVATAGWTWVAAGADDGTWLVAVLAAAAVAVVSRWRLLAALLIVAAGASALIVGVPYGAVDLLLAAGIILFVIGRYDTLPILGALTVAALAGAAAARGGFELGRFTITCAVFGGLWGFGLLVRHRAVRAQEAVAAEEDIARRDVRELQRSSVLLLRAGVARSALESLRLAIHDMQDSARSAAESQSPAALEEIRAKGAAAVAQLRSLLVILRKQGPHLSIRSASLRGDAELVLESPLRLPTWVPAAVLAIVCGIVLVSPATEGSRLPLVVIYGAAVATHLLLARSVIAPAAVMTIAAATVAWDPPIVPETLLPTVLAYAAIAWVTACRRDRWSIGGALLAMVGAAAIAWRYGGHAEGFVMLVFVMPYLAGLAWSERDAILREARRQEMAIRLDQERAAATAMREERLRLAREIHDVTSHAVGAMVLHASAARALLGREAAAYREALDVVVRLGDEALADVDRLFVALSTPSALSQREVSKLIADIVDHFRRFGMSVEIDLADSPLGSDGSMIVYTVVREALTNAARYAPGAPVTVRTRTDGDAYVVEVSDAGAAAQPTLTGTGFGLAGLRERTAALGGTLEVGRVSPRGFRVEARLPITT